MSTPELDSTIQPIQPNLDGVTPSFQHTKIPRKRTWENILPSYEQPSKVLRLLKLSKWEYKSDMADELQCRDLAFGCLLYLTSARVNEMVRVNREQVVVHDENFLVLQNMRVSKRRIKFRTPEEKEDFRFVSANLSKSQKEDLKQEYLRGGKAFQKPASVSIPLPRKTGDLARFTVCVEAYLDQFAPEGRLFKFGTHRGWEIHQLDHQHTQVYIGRGEGRDRQGYQTPD